MSVVPEPGAREAALGPAEFYFALRRLPPRCSHLLAYRVLDRRSAEECARLYGTSEAAISVHVLRAARLLRSALAAPGKEMLPSHEAPLIQEKEEQAARALAVRLDSPAGGSDLRGPGDEPELGELLLRLRALATEVRRLAEEREREEAASPARRRADWLRRLAWAALAAVALWLYLRTGQ